VSLKGKVGEGFGKKEGASGKNVEFWEGRVLGVLVFFIIQNPPNLEELGEDFGGF